MFGVYDPLCEGFISFIDFDGYSVGGRPITFETEELAEGFIVWFCAWLDVDEEIFIIEKIKK